MMTSRRAAFYIRLSDADEAVRNGKKEESNSITSQRKLLHSFVRKKEEFNGFEILEYFDDGYSGTCFDNRKEFQRMIRDAENGRFECIIVKDFSRFGRDYLEVGNYLEFIFPVMGMRFISVNDNYDSNNSFGVTGGMDVAYKNLIYQLYSMDLSRKVKSARRTRNLNGEYTASFVCFGYKKDPNDKHRLIVDEWASEIVREIFALAISGCNACRIARILNEKKVPTRLQNQWKNGVKYAPLHNHEDYIWYNETVLRIIRNEQYKGIMIQNKSETAGFGESRKIVKRDRKDWSIVEGAIPRIISDEVFDKANRLITRHKRTAAQKKSRQINLFKCPYCGRKLVKSSTVAPKLRCRKGIATNDDRCSKIFMPESKAWELALNVVREACRMQIGEYGFPALNQKSIPGNNQKIIEELECEHERIEKNTVSFYQSYKNGIYTKEEYLALRKKNRDMLAVIKSQIESMQAESGSESDRMENVDSLFDMCSKLEEYDGNVLANIVEEIFIYNDKDMQVVFKGQDFFSDCNRRVTAKRDLPGESAGEGMSNEKMEGISDKTYQKLK